MKAEQSRSAGPAKTHRMVLDMIKAGEADKAGELWSRHLPSGGGVPVRRIQNVHGPRPFRMTTYL